MGTSQQTSANELENFKQQFRDASQQLTKWRESTSDLYIVDAKERLNILVQKLSIEAARCFQQRLNNMAYFLRKQQSEEKFSEKDRLLLNEMTETLKQTLTILNDPSPENIINYLDRAKKAPGIYIS